jgi:hypothetical protein
MIESEPFIFSGGAMPASVPAVAHAALKAMKEHVQKNKADTETFKMLYDMAIGEVNDPNVVSNNNLEGGRRRRKTRRHAKKSRKTRRRKH